MEFNISGNFLESSHLVDNEGNGNHTKYTLCKEGVRVKSWLKWFMSISNGRLWRQRCWVLWLYRPLMQLGVLVARGEKCPPVLEIMDFKTIHNQLLNFYLIWLDNLIFVESIPPNFHL